MSLTGLLVLDRHSASRPAIAASADSSLELGAADFSLLLQATQSAPLSTLAAGTVLRPLAQPAAVLESQAALPFPAFTLPGTLTGQLGGNLPDQRQPLSHNGDALPHTGKELPLVPIDPQAPAAMTDLMAADGPGPEWQTAAPAGEAQESAPLTERALSEEARFDALQSPAMPQTDIGTRSASTAGDTLTTPEVAGQGMSASSLAGVGSISGSDWAAVDAARAGSPARAGNEGQEAGASVPSSTSEVITQFPGVQTAALASTGLSHQANQAAPGLASLEIAERMRSWRNLSGPVAAMADPARGVEPGAAAAGMAVVSSLAAGNDMLVRQAPLPGQLQVFAEQLQAAMPAAESATPAQNAAPDEAALPPPARVETPAGQLRPTTAAAFNPHTFNQTLGHAIDEPQWGESFARHISLLSGQRVSSAEVQLDPPELGSLLVRINIVGEQASISFTSPHLQVRDCIEQNVDKLHTLLNEQGLDLVDVNVSDQTPGRQGTPGRQAQEHAVDGVQDNAGQETDRPVTRQLGLVDTYI